MSLTDLLGIIWLLFSWLAFYYARKSLFLQKYPDWWLERFRDYLKDFTNWKDVINTETNESIWRYTKNIDYEFFVKYISEWNSKEPWMPNFPDNHCSKYEVTLKIRWKSFMENPILFISMDWLRWFIPAPEIWSNWEYLWKKYSTQLLIDKIIGKYYWWNAFPKNIEEFSEHYSISLV